MARGPRDRAERHRFAARLLGARHRASDGGRRRERALLVRPGRAPARQRRRGRGRRAQRIL